MSEIVVRIYKCDVCNKEFSNPEDIHSTHIPCFGGESSEYFSECKVDLCVSCSGYLRKLIFEKFAHINDYYGVHIINKQSFSNNSDPDENLDNDSSETN